MKIEASDRVQSIGGYAFDEIDKKVKELENQGIHPIDFGVGDPTTPTPKIVRDAVKTGVDRHATTGYPSYIGSDAYREKVAQWSKMRFGVDLDPATEITSTIGSKEGIFNFAEGFVNPGDYVLIPTPGYPPFSRGTLFAEGKPYFYPLRKENGFLPDFSEIPSEIAQKARLIWINYPNNPTGATATREFYEEAVEFGKKHEIIVCSDEAYSEIYFGQKPPSILEVTKENVVSFNSLSKRSAMTGYRVGWVSGDARIIEVFKKVKTNIDSGTPNFVQEAAIAALSDESHVEEMRSEYKAKRDILQAAFKEIGFPESAPQGTIHYFQELPEGTDAVEFAKKLLSPEIAIVGTPGPAISQVSEDGFNPGQGFFRLSLVPNLEATKEAAGRIKEHLG